MKGFKFVRVFESGEEEPIPDADVADAERKSQSPVFLRSLTGRTGAKIEGSTSIAMVIVWILADMSKYRGARIDAIEVGSPH